MSNFTKGEWELTEYNIVSCKGNKVAHVSSGDSIPLLKSTQANANLISAAPDMYDHIQQDIEILQRECKNHVLGSYQLRHLHLRIKSKKALLAKARGE